MDYNYVAIQESTKFHEDDNKEMEIPSHLKEKMPKIKICPVPDDGKIEYKDQDYLTFENIIINPSIYRQN
ncbi:hypothetical protein PIROE2DRAFT_4954 [Piromyces sp. E2]|nr:hypothetical protein PIROE2DRAFT_4954 [Piromyces sp. E2]|eukprot:OUM67549.1 hypothetical protein PIROE2DRAFT_4954 [Piromyces sp. E2]